MAWPVGAGAPPVPCPDPTVSTQGDSASFEQMNTNYRHIPPIGVHLTQDVANRHGRFRARARWSDPLSHERRSYSATFETEDKARAFLEQLQSRTHIASDPLISLADYIAEIGDGREERTGDNLTCPTEVVPVSVANWWPDPEGSSSCPALIRLFGHSVGVMG